MRGYFFGVKRMSVTPRRPLAVQPHPYIGDVVGRPLDRGMIYFGEPDKDPQDYPITVYLDPEQTKPAHQPIRTKGGFINVFGDITEIFADEILYSLKVLDCYGRLVFYKKRMHRDNITEELGGEIVRAQKAESALQSSIDAETTRAKKAESDLNANIIKEVSDRKLEVTRLDKADAVLQAQINSVGGGKLAYKTYAEMIADKSNIAAKSSIDIIADTDDKNGTYLYDGANFVKSNYDLEKLIRAKVQNTFGTYAQMVTSNLSDGAYALVADDADDKNGIYIKEGGVWVASKYDTSIKQFMSHDKIDIAEQLLDPNGKLVRLTTSDGSLYLPGLDGSVQELFTKKDNDVDDDVDDDADYALKIKDSAQNIIPFLTNDGTLIVNDILTLQQNNKTAVNKRRAQELKNLDYVIASRDKNRMNVDFEISELKEGYAAVSSVVERIGANKFFCLWLNSKNAGDFSKSGFGEYSILSFDDNYNVQKTEPKTLLEGGTDEIGSFIRAAGQPFYVREGKHAGRLYIYYIKRYGTKKDTPCYIYSDDEGETWSEELDFRQFIPNYEEEWRLLLVSPAKCIQIRHGDYKGRIVLPCWTGGPHYPDGQYTSEFRSLLMYSDDGGETYEIGAIADREGGNESAVVEVDDTGRLMFIIRDDSYTKQKCYSTDGGETLTPVEPIYEVNTTRMQSGLVQAENDFDLSVPKVIMTTPHNTMGRENLGVYISYDGDTFDLSAQLVQGPSMYSYVDIIDESHLFIVYEGKDRRSTYGKVVNLKEILKGGV